MRNFLLLAGAALIAVAPADAQRRRRSDNSMLEPRGAAGIALLGFAPQGEFAENVHSAFGLNGHGLLRLDPQGIVALRADLSYMIYGSERYRAPLGGGPLGLISVDVNTTNNILLGGLGLQLMAPGPTVRPYALATAGFNYFFTTSSAEGSNNSDAFASSTNYDDGGFSWTAGGGLYVPLGRTGVNLDLGARWVDNGKRKYLRRDGITFANNQVQLNPVSSQAQGVQFTLGISYVFRY